MKTRPAILTSFLCVILMGSGMAEVSEVFETGAGLVNLLQPPPPVSPDDPFAPLPPREVPPVKPVAVRKGGPLFTEPPLDLRELLSGKLPAPLSRETLALFEQAEGVLYVRGPEEDAAAIRTLLRDKLNKRWFSRRVSAHAWRIAPGELKSARANAGDAPAKLEAELRKAPSAVHVAGVLVDLDCEQIPWAPAPSIVATQGRTGVTWPGGKARIQASTQPEKAEIAVEWSFSLPDPVSGSAALNEGETHVAEALTPAGETIAIFVQAATLANWEMQSQDRISQARQAAWREHAPGIQVRSGPDTWFVGHFRFSGQGSPLALPLHAPGIQAALAAGDLWDFRPEFEAQGIRFEPGSFAIWDAANYRLYVRQTLDQMELIEAYIQPLGELIQYGPHLRWICTSRKGDSAPRILTRASIRSRSGVRVAADYASAAGARVKMQVEAAIYFGGKVELQAELPCEDVGGIVTLAASQYTGRQLESPLAILGHGAGAVTLNSRWQILHDVREVAPLPSQSELAEISDRVAAQLWNP